jgi:hypothetical protein
MKKNKYKFLTYKNIVDIMRRCLPMEIYSVTSTSYVMNKPNTSEDDKIRQPNIFYSKLIEEAILTQFDIHVFKNLNIYMFSKSFTDIGYQISVVKPYPYPSE